MEKEDNFSERDYIITILLCFFFGVFGIHRIYCYKVKTGFLYMLILIFGIVLNRFCYYKSCNFNVFYILSFQIIGILVVVDLVLIICKRFKDKEGKVVCCSKFLKNRL